MNSNIKIKASTLVETLVGTAIIVIIFTVATLTLNRVFKNVSKNNTLKIDNQIFKLKYLQHHQKITLPYLDDFENWEIEMSNEQIDNKTYTNIIVKNKQTEKTKTIKYCFETE